MRYFYVTQFSVTVATLHECVYLPIGSTTHAIIACTIAATDNNSKLRHLGGRDGCDHFGTMFGNATGLNVSSNHKTRYVLQEDERNFTFCAELNEMGRLFG
jgi:hypothetical protein